jgi:hypothetical protein
VFVGSCFDDIRSCGTGAELSVFNEQRHPTDYKKLITNALQNALLPIPEIVKSGSTTPGPPCSAELT